MTLDGDLLIEDGDIALAAGSAWYALEVNKRLRSGGDWYHHPSIGIDVTQYTGFPNNAKTGSLIRDTVRSSLMQDLLHAPADLKVEVVPTSIDTVNILVIAELSGEREVASHTVLDFTKGVFSPLSEPAATRKPAPADHYTRTTNKYQARRKAQ